MIALLASIVLALTSPRVLPTDPPLCLQYFPAACNEAVGQWLRQFATPDTFWDRATHITQRDSFPQSPKGGTFVVFRPELQKAHVIYDAAHGRVFYETGCCSWSETVLAYSVAPPALLANQNLWPLRTTRGIQLGMTPWEVMRVYGDAMRLPLSQPGMTVLAYTTWPPRDKLSKTHSECGQFENFYFFNNALVLIQLGNGC